MRHTTVPLHESAFTNVSLLIHLPPFSCFSATSTSPKGDCILSSLATPPPSIKVVMATEPVTYHIQSDSACVGILSSDVVTETIIVTEYTEVELRTSEEGDAVTIEEDQANVVQLVNEEIEVKMESSGPVEARTVLVEPGHVSEEMVTVLEEPQHLAESVNSQLKEAIVTISKEAVESQSVHDITMVDSLQNVSVKWESIPGAVVVEGGIAPKSIGASGVMDVDIKDNASCSGQHDDLAVENLATSGKDGEENNIRNVLLIKCSQEDSQAGPSVSPPQDEILPLQKEDFSAVREPSTDLSNPEVTKGRQTVMPRRGPGRPRKSEKKKTPVSTRRRRGRPPIAKKENEDIAVVIPLSSENK